MGDLTELLPLASASVRFPRNSRGGTPCEKTLREWALRGAKRPDGTRVRLGTVRVGGRTFTSAKMIAEFVAGQQ